MGWPTAQAVLTQAALELGLVQSTGELGTDAFEATDPNVLQLTALLKKAGRELVDEADWTHLRQEYSIRTQSPAEASAVAHQRIGVYLLPRDWRNMVDQSGWNRTNRLPLGGPLSEQEWQYLTSRMTGVVFTVLFRPMQQMLHLYPSGNIPDGQAITMAYKSSFWVTSPSEVLEIPDWQPLTNYQFGDLVSSNAGAGGPFTFPIFRCVQPGVSGSLSPDPAVATSPYVPTMSGVAIDNNVYWNYVGLKYTTSEGSFMSAGTSPDPDAGADLLMFDEVLLVAKLKLLWLRVKGFDSTDAERDYNNTLARVVSNDCASPKLSLNGPKLAFDPLLGLQNFPITGFGS